MDTTVIAIICVYASISACVPFMGYPPQHKSVRKVLALVLGWPIVLISAACVGIAEHWKWMAAKERKLKRIECDADDLIAENNYYEEDSAFGYEAYEAVEPIGHTNGSGATPVFATRADPDPVGSPDTVGRSPKPSRLSRCGDND